MLYTRSITGFAEDPVGADHQGQDHQHVGGEILGAAAHVRVDVAGGDALHDPHDESAHDGPRNRVEAAQDHDREHLEPTRERFTSTPSMFPHRTPPNADTIPVMAQASPK